MTASAEPRTDTMVTEDEAPQTETIAAPDALTFSELIVDGSLVPVNVVIVAEAERDQRSADGTLLVQLQCEV